jgi:ketosteroid isomerase-like protein
MHHYGEKEFQLIIEDYDPAADGYETMRSATASQTLSAEYLHRFGVLLEANDNAGFEFIADQQTHAKRSVIEQCVIGMYQARVENDIAACTAHFASQAHIALLGENKNIYQTNESATMNVADQIKLLVDIWSWQEVANQRLVIDGSNVAAFYELTTVFNPTGETITTYISDHMRVNDQGEITEFIEFVDTALVARLASGIE